MWNDFIYNFGLAETDILYCKLSCFFDLTVGCAQTGFKIDPILFDWIHPVPGLYVIIKISCLVDDGIQNVGGLDLVIWESCKFPLFQEIFDLVKIVSIGVWVL